MIGLPPLRRQQGVILILLFLVLFSGASAVALNALSHQNPRLRDMSETLRHLQSSREALLDFAMTLPENSDPVRGPGRLPCPDSNNNGQPNLPCPALGRLPRAAVLAGGAQAVFGDYQAGLDRQFWYALTPAFSTAAPTVNSSVSGTLSLDGESDIVAVLIAPGAALGTQARPHLSAVNYLEGGNRTGPHFSNPLTLDSGDANDLVVPIRRRELMTRVTARVAREVQSGLEAFHVINARFPDASEFPAAMSAAAPWFVADSWADASVIIYTPDAASPATHGRLTFATGCAITYTFTQGAPLSRHPNQC